MWAPWEDVAAGVAQWREWTDEDYTRARSMLETAGFEPVGRELARDAVWLVACEHCMDSAQLWLERQRWDGTPRVSTFLSRLAGVEASPYAEAVSRYLWTALAGRVMVPGTKADMVPILVGGGGVGKSTGIKALVPGNELACRVDLQKDDVDNGRKMRGCLVAEIAELRGLGTRDSESIKDFLSAEDDKWTPKFKEMSTRHPRRCVFIGSTDKDAFLVDSAANFRRWLPVRVGKVDVWGIGQEREQLWAEAAGMFLMDGVAWEEAERLGRVEHEQFTEVDSWLSMVLKWADGRVGDSAPDLADEEGSALTWAERGFSSGDALTWAVGLPTAGINRSTQMRMGAALTAAGFKRERVWAGPDRGAWVWRRG